MPTTANENLVRVASSRKTNNRSSTSRSSTMVVFKADKRSPLNFDSFVPQMCLDMAVSQIVVVLRKQQDKYIPVICTQKTKCSKYKSPKKFHRPPEDTDRDHSVEKLPGSSTAVHVDTPSKSEKSIQTFLKGTIPILAYYDELAQLVQVTILKCPFKIHRRVIRAINYCLPFHSFLTKLVISKGALTREILCELGKLLPRSNITEIFLDDSNVPNYHSLLDHLCQLRHLSLCRCNIDDFECVEISTRLKTGHSLQILDLTSNFITDLGAQGIGEMLTKNRQLRYLNLAGNEITDDGASFLLTSLMKFPISEVDVVEKRRRRFQFLERRVEVDKMCLEEIAAQRPKNHDDSILSNYTSKARPLVTASGVKGKAKENGKASKNVDLRRVSDNANDTAEELMKTEIFNGDFIDVFDKEHTVTKDGFLYYTGNFTLCSLSLAYNKLNYSSLKHILKVLEYQEKMKKPANSTGLIRLVIEGNNLPIECVELVMIEHYLKKAIVGRSGSMVATTHKKRLSFSSRRVK